jgi:hypothetical protein
MTNPLLPTRFLFRFSAPCRYRSPLWTADGAGLDETYRLIGLAELEGQATWADVRAAWSEEGLAFTVVVRGKRQPPWCRESRPEDSDSFQVWIDTRDVHNVHRAGRFCHRFVFLPTGGEKRGQSPFVRRPCKHGARLRAVPANGDCPLFSPGGGQKAGKKVPALFSPAVAQGLPINRAREQPRPIPSGLLKARCQHGADGYLLEALIPAEALTGFDPAEHPRLGFTYAIIDRELGQQTFGVGSPMPYQEDPSLWATLDLQR